MVYGLWFMVYPHKVYPLMRITVLSLIHTKYLVNEIIHISWSEVCYRHTVQTHF